MRSANVEYDSDEEYRRLWTIRKRYGVTWRWMVIEGVKFLQEHDFIGENAPAHLECNENGDQTTFTQLESEPSHSAVRRFDVANRDLDHIEITLVESDPDSDDATEGAPDTEKHDSDTNGTTEAEQPDEGASGTTDSEGPDADRDVTSGTEGNDTRGNDTEPPPVASDGNEPVESGATVTEDTEGTKDTGPADHTGPPSVTGGDSNETDPVTEGRRHDERPPDTTTDGAQSAGRANDA